MAFLTPPIQQVIDVAVEFCLVSLPFGGPSGFLSVLACIARFGRCCGVLWYAPSPIRGSALPYSEGSRGFLLSFSDGTA